MEISLAQITEKLAKKLCHILSTDGELHIWLNPDSEQQVVMATDFLQHVKNWQSQNNATTYAIVLKGDPIGTISLSHLNALDKSGRVGYWLTSTLWGKGYGTEAFSLIVGQAQKLGLKTLRATIEKSNTRSLNIWKKYSAHFVSNENNAKDGPILAEIDIKYI